MASPSLLGSCGCGAIRFEISEPLVGAAYCHCGVCQKRTGTAVQASAAMAPGSLTITAGRERLREWAPANGGNVKSFCEVCGSHLFARSPSADEFSIVRMAAIDGDPGVRPSARQFVAFAADWEPIPDDGLPRFEGLLPWR